MVLGLPFRPMHLPSSCIFPAKFHFSHHGARQYHLSEGPSNIRFITFFPLNNFIGTNFRRGGILEVAFIYNMFIRQLLALLPYIYQPINQLKQIRSVIH